MSLPSDVGPASHLYVILPAYDPLLDYYRHGVSPPVLVRIPSDPGRHDSREDIKSRMARCGAASRDDHTAEALAAPYAPGPGRRAPAGITGRPGRLTGWLFRLRHGFRSALGLGGVETTEAMSGPRLQQGASGDDISHMEVATEDRPKPRDPFLVHR